MRGIKESATVNSAIVVIKVAVVLAVVGVGAFYIKAQNYVPFIPENTGEFGAFRLVGHLPRGRRHLLRLYRFRCRLDRRAGSQKSPARHGHRHPRLARYLHGALYRLRLRADRARQLQRPAKRRAPCCHGDQPDAIPMAENRDHARRDRRLHHGYARHAARAEPRLLCHVARRLSAQSVLGPCIPSGKRPGFQTWFSWLPRARWAASSRSACSGT